MNSLIPDYKSDALSTGKLHRQLLLLVEIGRGERIRTTIFRLMRPVFFQLNYTAEVGNLAADVGLEPTTYGLEIRRSYSI